jgi:hypothetical protein
LKAVVFDEIINLYENQVSGFFPNFDVILYLSRENSQLCIFQAILEQCEGIGILTKRTTIWYPALGLNLTKIATDFIFEEMIVNL